MKKITVLLLIISMFLCSISFVGCENTDGDGTVELTDGLIDALNEVLEYYMSEYFLSLSTLETKIDRIKETQQAVLTKINPSDYYYAVAYYNPEHENSEFAYCCRENYTWVGFEKETNIKEIYDGKQFVVAFQINRSSLCEKLLDEFEQKITSVEYYQMYTPEFKNGLNKAKSISCDDCFIFIESNKEGVAYSGINPFHKYWHQALRLNCVEIDGEIYMSHATHSVKSDGKTSDVDLVKEFGDYYDTLMELMITDEYSETHEDNSVTHYGLFEIDDVLNLIKE